MQCSEVLANLRAHANPKSIAGMARFGINSENTLGISIPTLRQMAREIGPDQAVAHEIWNSGIHEAKILATMIDVPSEVTEEQMETWVLDFDSWDVCDQCCNNLFHKAVFAHQKAVEWSERPEEFVKRAGFVLMAVLAVHDKRAEDSVFEDYLPIIAREASDGRNFVKKAVNWALRQIGKRNLHLNAAAVKASEEILAMDSKFARWIAADALRELTSTAVKDRLCNYT